MRVILGGLFGYALGNTTSNRKQPSEYGVSVGAMTSTFASPSSLSDTLRNTEDSSATGSAVARSAYSAMRRLSHLRVGARAALLL